MLNCYGRYRRQSAECQVCEHRAYCMEAREKRSYAKEFNEEDGSLLSVDAYEALGVNLDAPFLAESESVESESVEADSAENTAGIDGYMCQQFFTEIVEVTKADPTRIFIIIGKLAGMSMARMGGVCGMSKQAIHKHCLQLSQSSPTIRRFLSQRFAENEHIVGVASKQRYNLRKNDGRRLGSKSRN